MFQQNEETPHTPRMKKRKPRKHAREKLKEQKTVWKKFMESDGHMTMVLSYCGLFLIYGMTDELLGPTLIELSCLVSRKIQSMSWLFFSHDAGLLLGTLVGGFIVSRVDQNLAVTICLSCNAVCMSILPVLHKFSGMVVFVMLYGIFLGTPDTLTNVMLIKTFGKEVAPYLQSVHFFYGFGAFLSPLVARPFLRKTCKYVVNTTVYFSEPDPTKNLTFDRKSGFWALTTTEYKRDNESDVMYAYWIVGLCHVPVVFGLAWLYFKRHLDYQKGIYRGSFTPLYNDDDLPVQSLDIVAYDPEATFWDRIQKDVRKRLLAVTILSSVTMYLYEGLMAMYGGYAYSFAVKNVLSMTSDQGAYLTSMYWGFFSVGRFLCIILAFFISPKSMLMGNVTGCLLSSIVLLAGYKSLKSLYTGTCMLGFFLSSTAPSIISMAEQYVDLTAHSTSLLVISSALGELTMPLLVGQAFDNLGAGVVPVTAFLLCFLGFIAFCLLLTFDNDKAYEKASIFWKIIQNFWCLGCESAQQKKYKNYTNLTDSSEYSSSSEISERDHPQIPKPELISTNKVQPDADPDEINENEIIGDFNYGDFIPTSGNSSVTDDNNNRN